jgi:hypothetical protein
MAQRPPGARDAISHRNRPHAERDFYWEGVFFGRRFHFEKSRCPNPVNAQVIEEPAPQVEPRVVAPLPPLPANDLPLPGNLPLVPFVPVLQNIPRQPRQVLLRSILY